MSNIGKWMYQIGEKEVWFGDLYNTEEEAIKHGLIELKHYNLENSESLDTFYVARIGGYMPRIDVIDIIERIQENACDNYGELAETYLDDVSRESLEYLGDELNKVLMTWINKNNHNLDVFDYEYKYKMK